MFQSPFDLVLTCSVVQGLLSRVSQHPEGKLIEPQTGEVFEWDELKKVRVLEFVLIFFLMLTRALCRSSSPEFVARPRSSFVRPVVRWYLSVV